MKPEEMTDVPSEDVPNVVKGYIQSGAKIINCIKQNDPNWTIKAS